MPLGLYVAVPFCRTKCTYCNFSSGVFSRSLFQRYVNRLCHDIEDARQTAGQTGALLPSDVDSIYFGGGTPTVLDCTDLERLFVTIRQNFCLNPKTEITVECAPGTLSEPIIQALQRCGVDRISLGVQSFVDREAAAVGRLHKRETVLGDIARLRAAGISNINIDLIAGLPHQTAASWQFSLNETIAAGVSHASVYMLEIDDDSRLGRELIAGGKRYHAHFVPDEDLTADLYEIACEQLNTAGIRQYEISNFAQHGHESRHNLKYWTRQPYIGFGVDAHSMLPANVKEADSIRFATADSLEEFFAGKLLESAPVSLQAAREENFFLGLRLNCGVNLAAIGGPAEEYGSIIGELVEAGLLEQSGECIRLTSRGRLLSNEVFARFIATPSSMPVP